MSVLAFDDRVESALWRSAWSSYQIHAAFGASRKDGEPLTVADFYGREWHAIRVHLDRPSVEPAPEALPTEAVEKEAPEVGEARVFRSMLLFNAALAKRKRGGGPIEEETPSPPE